MTLQLKGISKFFNGKIALQDINIELERGEIVGLLGPNGAGKTTCFRIMAGLTVPDKGHILLQGEDITPLSIYQRGRKGINYLPQESSVFTDMSVAQNIKAILEISTTKDLIESTLERLLAEFNLTSLAKQKAHSLSGGQKRRLEIARLLANKPQFVLLDEPLAGVDPIAINDVKLLIQKLKQENIGVLITDHNVREKLAIIDRGYVIYNGIMVVSGNKDVIVNHDLTKKIYLGENFY
jgi:lipopolysaccharide export system ATP-binding protein